MKSGVGLDYCLYQSAIAQKPDRFRLSRDHAEPITLVLNGTRRVMVKVVDDRDQPLPNAKVFASFMEKPHKAQSASTGNFLDGGVLYISGVADFETTTNEAGQASLDWLPADGAGISLMASVSGYRPEFQQAFIDSGSGDVETTIKVYRMLPLHGRVAYSDGRPAAGVAVFQLQLALDDGRESGPPPGSATMFTDDQGFFQGGAFPNHVQLLRISVNQRAASLTTCFVQENAPEPLQIVLGKATRVHGRLTAGPDSRPITKGTLSVWQTSEDLLQQLRDRGLALKSERARRAAPIAGPSLLAPPWPARTDDEGQFEFYLAAGKYQLRYDNETARDLQIDDEAELEANLHAERVSQVDFAGRVVLEGQEQQRVENVRITAYYPEKPAYSDVDSTTNAKGTFRFARRPVDMVLYARDEEGLFANIVQVGANDDTVIIPLRPAASARGRLVDATTGEPLRSVRIAYGVKWDGASTLQECGGTVQTDERGEFKPVGLVPGTNYRFTVFHPGPRDQVAAITPDRAEETDLGDYRIDLTGKAKRSATGPVAPKGAPPILDTTVEGKTQLAAAVEKAKTEKKHILLVVGANWSAWSHRLAACFAENDDVATALRENFIVMLVDAENWTKTGDTLVIDPALFAGGQLPVLVVLDGDGHRLATQNPQFKEDDHYNPKLVLDWLNAGKPGAQNLRAVAPLQLR